MAGTMDIEAAFDALSTAVSMESGLDGRNNGTTVASSFPITEGSQWSPA
ncbi:Uncharacterised protein [Arachnia propionica]|uniref:Uncharacterized protein n=1 Tax=Arachnia propionica TaxID=1750 RepID=A0A3S4W8L9_9ACTN|nr:Uncharacterised protein [Arachnia propionica]